MNQPTHEEREAIRRYVEDSLSPLITQLLVKQLSMAAVFLRDQIHGQMPKNEEAVLLNWAEKNNVAWCSTAWADGADSHIYHGSFNNRKTVFAPTLRQAIQKAMMQQEQTK